jgi:all-trans-retinol dehydrogenase (NAD+)
MNKTALISGAARGIGQAIAAELARCGVRIIGVDLRVEDLRDTSDLVKNLGCEFTSLACDVADEHAIRKMMTALSQSGGFDILINNAGVLPSGPFAEGDFSAWRKVVGVNVIGLMAMTHAALPILKSRGAAHVVNMASVAGKFGTEGVAAYGASKHGVVGFSSALRFELAEINIGVSWICPSMVSTQMAAGVPSNFFTPLMQPGDVAKAVRRAIETNAAEVYVPRRMRFLVSIMPSLLPGFSRWLSWHGKASRGWLAAKKKITDAENGLQMQNPT